MKIVRIHRFGGPEVLTVETADAPSPKGNEALVRVHAASVNPIDVKQRTGDRLKESDLPAVLGRDLAGEVIAIGPEQVDLKKGDAVLAHIGWERGAYAEQVIVKPGEWAVKPDALGWVEAGALPLVADTAWQGLVATGRVDEGWRVLIHAASGGVGRMGVQFAHQRKAIVFATGGKDSLDDLRALGADHVIDYENERFEDVATELDLVFDLVGGDTRARSWSLLKPGGVLVTTVGGDVEAEGRAHGRTGKAIMAQPAGKDLADFAHKAASGKLKVDIARTFPIDQVANSHRFLEEGHPHGKVVLTF